MGRGPRRVHRPLTLPSNALAPTEPPCFSAAGGDRLCDGRRKGGLTIAGRDHHTYRLSWSAEDNEHVAARAGFPSLSWLDEIEALRGIKKLVREAVEDLRASGEPVPEPLADKEFSGRFVVRIPPEQHRAPTVRAAEAGVSLNRCVAFKLAAAG